MGHPSTTIDLGELSHAQLPPDPGPWPGWVRLRRLIGHRPWRLLIAAAVTMATVLGVSAAAPVPGPLLSLHLTLPVGSMAAADEVIYILERPGQRVVATAYRLTDGSELWRADQTDTSRNSWLHREDDLLLLNSAPTGPASGPADYQLRRLDPRTGAPLWTTVGQLDLIADDRLLVRHTPVRPAVEPIEPLEQELTWLDPDTGAQLWQRRLIGWQQAADPVTRRLLALDPDGVLTAYDLDTGARLGSVDTWDVPAGSASQVGLSLHEPSSLALVEYGTDSESGVLAYDAATLRLRWSRLIQAEPDTPAVDRHHPIRAQSCGELVCLDHPTLDAPEAVDPATGARLWSLDWLAAYIEDDAAPAGGGIQFTIPEHPALAGLLLLNDWSGPRPASWLVDGATGELVLELADWQLGMSPGTDPAVPPLVLHRPQVVSPQSEQKTLVGVLRRDPPRVEPLAAIDQRYGFCVTSDEYVFCHSEPGGVGATVWRVRV